MLKEYIKVILILIVSFFTVEELQAKQEKDREFTVVIDAGHGGKDIGATDNGVKEKDINLKVAKNLESLIKKKMKDTHVVMTRDNDTYLTLQQRADIANKSRGDIFISIHTNSVDKKNKNRKNVAGSSVYTLGLHKDENNLEVAMRENAVIELEQDYEQKYSGFDPQRDESYIIFEMAQKKNLAQSIKFAENVEKELVKSGRQDRGVHQAGFWVLWATSMPSVLIELDFICNPESAKYISSDKGAKELAEAIFKALQKYESSWRKALEGGITTDADYTYYSNSEDVLEDTYLVSTQVPVAKAKSRVRTHVKTPETIKTNKRKRRSANSKQLSLSQSYENDKIDFIISNQGFKESFEELPDNEILAFDSNAGADLPLKEKESKKQKKEKTSKKKKEEKPKKEKKRKDDAHNAKVNKLVTVYKIQILASSDLLSPSNSRFCGLSPITTYKENNLYKYYYGESTNKSEIEAVLPEVRKKIPDAFIVSSKKTVKATN